MTSILHRYNAVGLPYVGEGEYRAEAQTIVASVNRFTTLPETLKVVHGEFVHWFGPDMAGPKTHYTHVAIDVWRLSGIV